MAKKTEAQFTDEIADLKVRLEETEENLRAIRQYLVDAFVVSRSGDTQIVTLSNADFPYRMMVESMNEGAVTLIPDGTIFYCNPRFAEMVQIDADNLVGLKFQDLIITDEQSAFEMNLAQTGKDGTRGEFYLKGAGGRRVPVQLSIHRLESEEMNGISITATDISERVLAEEKLRSLASKLTMAEQNERRRISQILHDEMQQCLYAVKTRLFLLTDQGGEHQLPAAMQTDLDQIQSLLADAIAITRNLSMELSPVVLKGDGLNEVLAWLSSHMEEQYGLQVRLETKENFNRLEDHMRVMLFQAVRELLFNIVKHAGTSYAEVTLEKVDDHGRIVIRDSGKGFDTGAVMANPKAAHGLLLIQDRLDLIGAGMKVTSRPGEGTSVEIDFPFGGSSA